MSPYVIAALCTGSGTVLASTIAGIFSVKAYQHSRAADNAVNHRKPGEMRLVEMVDQLVASDDIQQERMERMERAIERASVKTERNGDRLLEIERKLDSSDG